MNKITIAPLLLAAIVGTSNAAPEPSPTMDTNRDSLRAIDSTPLVEPRHATDIVRMEQHTKDSLLFANKIPDSLRSRVLEQAAEFEVRKARLDSLPYFDDAKAAQVKGDLDSLRKAWKVRRDAQVANIQDSALQAKVKARLIEIAQRRAASQALIASRKAELDARIVARKGIVPALNSNQP